MSLDITARKTAELTLARNLEATRAITENSSEAMFLIDAQGRTTFANPAAARLFGWPHKRFLGCVLHDVLHHHRPDGAAYPSTDCPLVHAYRSGTTLQGHEDVFFRSDGTPIHVSCSIGPIWHGSTPAGAALIVGDITGRKVVEEHREVLVRELNHRVKNTLASVTSIAKLSMQTGLSAEEFLSTLLGRLGALQNAHEALDAGQWVDGSLCRVLKAVLEPYQTRPNGDRITIHGPDQPLVPTAAVSLSMLFHELATNASKYGALSVQSGHVDISWHIDPEANVMSLVWRETGGPRVSLPSRKGFGSLLIERLVRQDAGGESDLEFRPEGLIMRLKLPLGELGK